jgi:hypothetical protein
MENRCHRVTPLKATTPGRTVFVFAVRETKFGVCRMPDVKRLAHLKTVKSALRTERLRSVKIEAEFRQRIVCAATFISLHRGIKRGDELAGSRWPNRIWNYETTG